MFGRTALLSRNAVNNFARFAHSHGGVPGENVPFSIKNRYRLTALFIAFFGSGLALPFIVVRHQLLKK